MHHILVRAIPRLTPSVTADTHNIRFIRVLSHSSMRHIPYELCDVCTERPLAGNALPVFTDAEAIDGETMHALARETNLSEIAFVLPPTIAVGEAYPSVDILVAGMCHDLDALAASARPASSCRKGPPARVGKDYPPGHC